MDPAWWALAAVAIVSLAGQAAAFGLTRLRRDRPPLLLGLVALAAGAMAGEALLHAIPEAAEAWAGGDLRVLGLVLAGGFGAMMLASTLARHRACCAPAGSRRADASAWTTTLGDSLCNFADGVAIAASFLVSVPLGLAATVAILIHELPQEVGQCAVLLRGGLSPRRALAWNAASALPAFAGAAVVLALPLAGEPVERFILPAVAGAFLHIAAADLLPMVRPTGDRLATARSTVGFGLGLALMVALLALD